ncbi:putative leucine Rich repeat-containing domain protein [Trichinella spiralis]|uniref:putative leucine Rich repeat-containing domain protein n=1 Tax=Trichinella spiralis TaxID=6334 RepID=UPI0001EFC5C1|nr:putative leucine Rich repeat-containing domain protein [Trichinella spiralis]
MLERNKLLYFPLFTLLSWNFSFTSGQCPPVKEPCVCTSSMHEPVSISCNNAGSLVDVIQAISGARNVQIDSLFITNTPIGNLPPLAFQQFVVVRLILNRNSIMDIDPLAFDGPLLDSLVDLDLRFNRLDKVPGHGVGRLRRLHKLNLAHNSIGSLASRPFASYASVDYLQRLDLSNNLLLDIDDGAFDGLRNLQELSLEANGLSAVPTTPLSHLRAKLTNLNFGSNRINTIGKGSLNFPQLTSLSLEYNGLADFHSDALAGLTELNYLYLTGNHFTQWHPDIYKHVGNLRVLAVGEMAISRLPVDAFKHITGLIRLEMSEAAIDTIEQGAFQRTPNIQAIVLNKNLLSKIRVDLFRGLQALSAIDLSNNRLTSVDDRAFAGLTALRNLDLSGNELKRLEPATFNGTFQRTHDARVLYLCKFVYLPNDSNVVLLCYASSPFHYFLSASVVCLLEPACCVASGGDNPWVCTEELEWLRRWLRTNRDIIIDKPECLSVCSAPEQLRNWPLRNDDFEVTALPILPDTSANPFPFSTAGWIILAIILAILLTTIGLLALVRYFVSQKHKRQKEEAEEQRVLSSAASGYQVGSAAGSAYPGSVLDLNLPPVNPNVPIDDRQQRFKPAVGTGISGRTNVEYFPPALNLPDPWWVAKIPPNFHRQQFPAVDSKTAPAKLVAEAVQSIRPDSRAGQPPRQCVHEANDGTNPTVRHISNSCLKVKI